MRLKYQMRGLGIGIIVTAILMGVVTSHGIPLTDAEIMARASELGMVDSNSLRLSDVGVVSTPGPESGGESGSAQGGTGDLESDESDGEEAGDDDNPESGGEDPDSAGQPESDGENPDSEGQPESEENPDSERQPEPSREDADNPENSESGGEDPDSAGSQEPGHGDPDMDGQEASSHIIRNGDTVTVEIETGMDSYTISVILAEAGLVESAGEFDDFLCAEEYSRKILNGVYEIPIGSSQEEIAKIITRNR